MVERRPIEKTALKEQLQHFGPHTLAVGVVLIVLGTAGIVLPWLMSIMTAGFVGGMLIAGGLIWAYHTFKNEQRVFTDWLKADVLLLAGGLLLLFPVPGVASLALLISFYLAMDAYASFELAYKRHPAKGWGWMAFNGLVDATLVVLFLVGWPGTSLVLVGIFVGISLVFDGWALIFIGWAARKADTKRADGRP